MKFKALLLTALVSVGFGLSPSVWAATVTVQSTGQNAYTYTMLDASHPNDISVKFSGQGNAELQNGDIIVNPGQKELFSDVTTVSGFNLASNGTFSLMPDIWKTWDSIFVGLKQGNSYAIFELTNSIISGTWSTSCGGNNCTGLSHMFTLGGELATPPNAVPVPAAVWLFGSALAGMFGASRRKQVA